MNKYYLCKARLWSIVIVFFVLPSYAQTTASVSGLTAILSQVNQKLEKEMPESVYIQFDKPYYNTGDTLWYKAYVLNTATFTDSKNSGLLYIDINNEKNQPVMNFILPIACGLGRGQIVLKAEDFLPGNYTVKAYTNWMRNGTDESLFSHQFYITANLTNSWLVNSRVGFNSKADTALLHILLQNVNKQSLVLQDLKLKITYGKKTMVSAAARTGIDGVIDLNFPLSPNKDDKQFLLSITERTKNDTRERIIMPLPINRPGKTDLQFMPEGGNLVAGLPAVVGFKALNEDGSGEMLSGRIINNSGKVVTTFKTQYKGMGHFKMTPRAGESYTAIVNLGGTPTSFPLPAVKLTGTVLNVQNADSCVLIVNILSTKENGAYYLIGQNRGIACYGGLITLKGNRKTIQISKDLFPTGITRFSLLNDARQSLNERLVFIDNNDNLQIHITTNKKVYAKRDSVALLFEVTDHEHKPVAGNFSLAITDNGQVKIDSTLQWTMLSSLLIKSGVKGEIETPGHYLQRDTLARADLDNLLITQGWTAYDWNKVFALPKDVDFIAEPEFEVIGRVTNAFGKVLTGTRVNLSTYNPPFVADTVTDANGWFVFQNLPRIDTPRFTVKAYNRHGRAFNVDMQFYQTEPIKPTLINRILMPWNANTDSTIIENAGRIATMISKDGDMNAIRNGRMLKEVKIIDKKIIKGSHNLNGLGQADQILDEKEIQKVGRVSLYDLLVKKVKGFTTSDGFKIYSQTLNFVFDGQFMGARDYMSGVAISRLLTNYTADDILGIEVMNNMVYSAKYNQKYRPGEVMHYTLSGNLNPAYIEITTRKGLGNFLDMSPGVSSYNSLPISWYPKQFYSPKYNQKQAATQVDYRSTLLWMPDINTGADGKANVYFYTSDMKGVYTLVMEGSNMNGEIASFAKTLEVD